MAKSPIVEALQHLAESKDIPMEMVVETLQAALAAAYRKDFGEVDQNIKVEFDLETGGSKVFDVKQIIEDVDVEELEAREDLDPKEKREIYNPKMHIMITDAKKDNKKAEVGDIIKTELEVPEDYGRMAAQTAKQVIIQKIKEAERNTVYQEFKDKENTMILGTVQRFEGRTILVDLGKATAIIPMDHQIPTERHRIGNRVKAYVVSVDMGPKGPEIILSRAHENFVRELFVMEIPEIEAGSIEITGIAREAGFRTKISVKALDENIDPIGSCVGQRGARVQTIISELNGEKIDIIEFKDDPKEYLSNALAPAKIALIELNEETQEATVTVAEDQLSLAIGRSGQNVRLAAKLTGWKINIKTEGGDDVVTSEKKDEEGSMKDEEESAKNEEGTEKNEEGSVKNEEENVTDEDESVKEETSNDEDNK